MRCCRRDGCQPADGRWRKSSKGRRSCGEVPGQGVCGGGGWALWAEMRGWGGVGRGGARGRAEGRSWRCPAKPLSRRRSGEFWGSFAASDRLRDSVCPKLHAGVKIVVMVSADCKNPIPGAVVERGRAGRACRFADWKMAGAVVKSRESRDNYCQIQLRFYDRNLVDPRRCVRNALKIRAVDFGFLLFFVATASICHLISIGSSGCWMHLDAVECKAQKRCRLYGRRDQRLERLIHTTLFGHIRRTEALQRASVVQNMRCK